MGIVTDHLLSLIKKQVEHHGLVVWYDPEQAYRMAIPEAERCLEEDGIMLAAYEGSFFALRHRIEPHLGGLEAPRLVVYVPQDREETPGALIEAEAAGVVVRPGQQPPTRNTRLSIVARNALGMFLGEEMATKLEKQVEQGKLSLTDLDTIADKGGEITEGVTTVIFHTGNPQEIALLFLSSDGYDEELREKRAIPELSLLLRAAFGADLPPDETPAYLRQRLARYLLASDLAGTLQGGLPEKLRTVPMAPNQRMLEACVQLVSAWRLLHDLRDSYAAHADRVEQELGVHQLDCSIDQMLGVDTFLTLEQTLQHGVIDALLERPSAHLQEIAKKRQARFWAEYRGDVQAEWALVETCAGLLLEAERIEQALKKPPADATGYYHAYVNAK